MISEQTKPPPIGFNGNSQKLISPLDNETEIMVFSPSSSLNNQEGVCLVDPNKSKNSEGRSDAANDKDNCYCTPDSTNITLPSFGNKDAKLTEIYENDGETSEENKSLNQSEVDGKKVDPEVLNQNTDHKTIDSPTWKSVIDSSTSISDKDVPKNIDGESVQVIRERLEL